MPSLAIPPLGNYSLALATSAECLGVTPWTSTSATPEMLTLGVQASPESSCLPFKATTGHFLKAAEEGVEHGVMVNSVGTCRLRYYRELQQKILDERGINMFIFGLGYDGVKPPLIRHFNPAVLPFLRSQVRAFAKVSAIDLIEESAWRVRARERVPGATTRVMRACLAALNAAGTIPEIKEAKRQAAALFAGVSVDDDRQALRVGLIGEATVLRDRYLNHGMEETLGALGAEVRNFFLLGPELRKIFQLGLGRRDSLNSLKRIARPYLSAMVGGHALESVAHALQCARKGYDGLIHVAPAGCMSEISVRGILRRISRDTGVPILELSFDEHTSHVGVVTRLEAFVDILFGRRRRQVA